MKGGNSNKTVAMKKYAHTFSIQILQGQNRRDGHMSEPILCVCVCVYSSCVYCIHLCTQGLPKWLVFIYPHFVSGPCSYHNNKRSPPDCAGGKVTPPHLMYAVLKLTGRPPVKGTAWSPHWQRLTGFLSD